MAITLILDGKKLELTDQDYLSAGGQAKIYRKGDTAYKVYDTDPGMGLAQKIQQLAVLGSRETLVAPLRLLKTKRGLAAGYTMPFIPSTVPLPKLFTTGFQTKNAIGVPTLSALVTAMIETIRFVHGHGFLMVDGNEFNYLVKDDFRSVFFIDVDSYQTPGFPATVLMPSIRDWTAAQFSTGSDWFSFAVVAAQLYLGIHPFRGTWRPHPEVKSLEERVLRRISVFHPEVAVPQTARDPLLIPANFRGWLMGVFQDGDRSEPPLPDVGSLLSTGRKQPSTVSSLRREELLAWPAGMAAPHQDLRFQDLGQTWLVENSPGLPVTSQSGGITVDTSGVAGDPFVFDGRLYLIQNGTLVETRLIPLGQRVCLVERRRWPLSPHAYQVLDGLVAVDHLGAQFLVIPFAAGACGQFRTALLDGHRIIDGRFHQRVAMVISSRGDQTYRTVFHWDAKRETVVWEHQEAVDGIPEANFVVLKGSTLVTLGETLELQIVGQPGTKAVTTGGTLAGGLLATDGDRLYWVGDSRLFRLTLGA